MGFPLIQVFGSQTILGTYAKLKKDSVDYSCPKKYAPEVTAVIPCLNEASRLPYALFSLNDQTYPNIDKVFVIDDGSKDETYEVAKLMGELTDLDVSVSRKEKSQGKTPILKSVARNCKTENMFVLDADTIIERDYVEKVIVPHYDEKVASSYGTIRPMTRKYKKEFCKNIINPVKERLEIKGYKNEAELISKSLVKEGWKEELNYYISEFPVIKFRDGLYALDQHFTKDSYQRLFGTTLFPIGAAAMYKPHEMVEVFNEYEKSLGDNLTNGEDMFMGFSFCDKGLKNVRVNDARMVTTEPKLSKLPKQTSIWNSSFVQNAYYFGDLTKNFTKNKLENGNYREPLGWCIAPTLIEKISYPTMLLGMTMLYPELAAAIVLSEFGVYATTAYVSTPKEDRKGLASSIAASAPIRLMLMPVEFYVMGKFGYDIITGNRKWRK